MKKILLFICVSMIALLVISCTKTNEGLLDEPNNIKEENGVISWDIVDFADGYIISINGKEYKTTSNFFNTEELNLVAGTYNIKVKAFDEDKNISSEYSQMFIYNKQSINDDTNDNNNQGSSTVNKYDIENINGAKTLRAYLGRQAENLELSNSINIDDRYYVYYFYLGTVERAPIYTATAVKYDFDTTFKFNFGKLTSEKMANSKSKVVEIIDTHSYTGGFNVGFQQNVELGAEFMGQDMNTSFTTNQSTDHHWTNNWGNTVTNSEMVEESYLSEYSKGLEISLSLDEENGFVKNYYYRISFYETIETYGVLVYDVNSTAKNEIEKYTVAYQNFIVSDNPTLIIEESEDGRFDYGDNTDIVFDVDSAINIASKNKPENVEVSTSNEIHIRFPYDMFLMANGSKGKTFVLDNDIDFKGINWKTIENFEGTLDGNNNKITNLTFEFYDNASVEWGLFKNITSDGEVKDLDFKNCVAKYIAPGVGYAVSNVKFGFLATYNYGEISGCEFLGNTIDIDANTKVSNQYVYCGVIVCENYGFIRESVSNQNLINIDCDSVSSDSADDKCTVAIAGGICAYNQREGNINSCTAQKNVIKTRVCYISDEGEDVKSTSSGITAFNYGNLSNNTAEDNTLSAIKRYYKAKWGLFGKFKGTEFEGEESQPCDQQCTRNYN